VKTGFNTDVVYDGVTYHVQTEDKGVDTPLILSLVFDRGTILAAKRSPYDDLLEGGLDEKALEERLNRQHKLMCAAIKAGRLEDLKKLTEKAADLAVSPVAVSAEVKVPAGIPKPAETPVWDIPEVATAEVLPEPELQPKVTSVNGIFSVGDAGETSSERLRLKVVGSDRFTAGDRRNLNVLVCKGAEEESVAGANVIIKILGSDFRPVIYHAKADPNGVAAVMIKIPSFREGRAAILVRATAGDEEAELRRSVSHEV